MVQPYMTREKAIEILKDWGILSANEVDLDLRNAVKLAIVALEREERSRKKVTDPRD